MKELLAIIQYSQFETGEVPGASADWNAIYTEAKRQSLLGLVAPYVPKEVLDADPKWKETGYRQAANYARYIHAQDELCTLLQGADIPFVILKGSAASIHYRIPSQRMMGDIDFEVLPEDFEKTRTLLIDSGYALVQESETYTRHISFDKEGTHFELHRKFSYEDLDIESYVLDGIRHAETGNVDDHAFPMLPEVTNGLVLLAHMRNHLRAGLGLRQVIDWVMYVYRHLDDRMWEASFRGIATEKGMDTLARVAARMGQKYLGLPETITWCKDADEETCDMLLENLLLTGNFGKAHGSGSKVEQVTAAMRREGVFHRLQKSGEYNWKAYKKHHWLKPFCWLYQICRYIRQGFKTGRNRKQLKGDLDRSRERYALMKRLKIN